MTARELQPFFLLAIAWLVFTATMVLGVAPALPEAYRGLAWGAVSLTGVPLAFWCLDLIIRQTSRHRRARWINRRLTGLRGAAAERVAEQLRRINRTFARETLQLEADRLRRELRNGAPRPNQRAAWLRLLSIDGPGSSAWWGLAQSLAAGGASDLATRAAAEARRAEHVSADQMLTLCEGLLGDTTDAWPAARVGRPHALAALALHAETLTPAELAELYQLLPAAGLSRGLELVLWNELLASTGDREEARRQAARLGGAIAPDGDLAELLRSGWRDALSAAGLPVDGLSNWGADRDEWLDLVPARWRSALGFEPWIYADPPVRHRTTLPIYALAQTDDLAQLAQRMGELTEADQPSRLGAGSSPTLLAAQLRARLWPREVRSKSIITQALAMLSDLKSPSDVAAGLVVLGEALGEETDARAEDLRVDLERVALRLVDPAPAALALEAAGRAWAPVQPAQALHLWRAAMEQAERLEPLAAARLIAGWVPGWLTETRRPDLGANGPAILRLAAQAAEDSRDPGAIEAAYLALLAQPPDSRDAELIARLEARISTHAGRLLRAWHQRDWLALARSTEELWRREPTQWSWLALALGAGARPGDEVVLRPLLDPLRAMARQRTGREVGAWLALAYTVDRLAERPSRPEASRALEALLALPKHELEAALPGLRLTLERPESAWLEAVEEGLLRRLATRVRGPRGEGEAEVLRGVEAVAAVLPPARLQALLDRWIAQWSTDATAYGRRLWATAGQ